MKCLLVFVSAVVLVACAVPVFEGVEELDMPYAIYEEEAPFHDELLRSRRSLLESEIEEMPFEDELPRQRRSLSEPDFEEIPFEGMPEQGLRYKRATCDALSFSSKWLTVNHSACAIHCIAKGFRGGKCVNTICNCRR